MTEIMTLLQLRKKHPRLIYQDFEAKPDGKNLQIAFNFLLEPDIRFRPEIVIPLPDNKCQTFAADKRQMSDICKFAFHLGLIEAISYWKDACPPELVVKAGYLSSGQIAWWKHLFIHGLGEFFYRNKVDFTQPDFLTISCQPTDNKCQTFAVDKRQMSDICLSTHGNLVLVGGGKDSIVTLEALKQFPGKKTALMLNPGPNALAAARLAGYQNPIIVTRIIDPKLLQLNKLGYLNGHTPFSAYLAFLGVLVAYLHGYKNVISSNELGAGEASLIYKSMEINHQYSKSFAFEKEFRDYASKYLLSSFQNSITGNGWRERGPRRAPAATSEDVGRGAAKRQDPNQKTSSFETTSAINYFSFLRPLYELQIAKLFVKLPASPKYDSAFISCNVGRGKFWCGRCPKCAFNYLSLFPFMSAERLKNIFKSDLFENSEIQKHILDLVGLGAYKPFDCVGTKDESILAAFLAVKKLQSKDKPIPAFLLQAIGHSEVASGDRRISTGSFGRRNVGFRMTDLKNRILENWSDQNFLPPEYSKLLKELNEL